MYRNKVIIAVTLAVKKSNLDLLKNYIAYNKIIDEWQLWINTKDSDDLEYIKNLSSKYETIKIVEKPEQRLYFENCIEPKHVYLKIDDSICWMDENSIQKLIDFKIDNPQYFLISGNVINNQICDHIHHRMGIVKNTPMPNYEWHGGDYTTDKYSAETRHKNLIQAIKENSANKYKFKQWLFFYYEMFKPHVIAWEGEDFAQIKMPLEANYESQIITTIPKQKSQMTCICGSALFSHFSYEEQHMYLWGTNLFQKYKEISENKLLDKKNKLVEDISTKLKKTQIPIF